MKSQDLLAFDHGFSSMVDLHLSVHLSMVRQPALLASWLYGSEGWLYFIGEVALKVRTRGSILSDYSMRKCRIIPLYFDCQH